MHDEDTRVLLVDMPRLVRDLLERAIRAAPGLCLVDVREDLDDLRAATQEARPEFVVVGLGTDGALPPQAGDLLAEAARRKLLGIECRDGRAFLYELRPTTTALGEVAPEDVVAAIRGHAAGARARS